MSVSITQRPAEYSPVNNPVIYKFTTTGGPYTNYRIEVEAFKSSNDVSLGEVFSFTPNSSGVTTADISSMIKKVLYREWSLPSGVSDSENEIGSIEFYIKYQELYTGSATSQISDSANTKAGVLAGLQIGSNADLSEYAPDPGVSEGMFLTKFDALKMWSDYPFTISFLSDQYANPAYREVKQYDVNGTLLSTDNDILVSVNHNKSGLIRTKLPSLNTLTSYLTIQITDFGYSFLTLPNNWTPGTTDLSDTNSGALKKDNMANGTTYSRYISIPSYIGQSAPNNITITATFLSIVFGSGTTTVEFYYANNSGTKVYSASRSYTSNPQFSGPQTFTFGSKLNSVDITRLYVSVSTTGSSGTNDFSLAFGSYQLFSNLGDLIELKTIQLESPCRNPVYLIWKNSLGGDAEWLFDWTQEYTHNYSDGKKCKRLVLYADGLSFNEFEAIDELNTPGEIVDVPIIELTTSVNKTSKKTDQQVYVVQTDGSKVGVVVITNPSRTQTKRRQHFIEIEIEFPETFL